jgi:site-specific recombinase XerD
MSHDFQSGFATQLCEFVEQKKAVGFLYEQEAKHLTNFDKLCCEHVPEATELTREVCNLWANKKSTETHTSFRNRLSPLREFARFIIRNGGTAHIIPINMVKKSARHQPYIYSKAEVSAIWREFDSLVSTKTFPAKQAVLSAVVRVLYCTGLHPCEVRRLKTDDVELDAGKFFIRESKGHKDRIVMLPNDLAAYVYDYCNSPLH